MRPAANDPTEELPQAIEALSVTTRAAMLEAVRCSATRLIAGSYVAPRGRGLPAARRPPPRWTHARRIDGVSTFADVWDRYTGASASEPRPIEQAERQMLEGLLVASLAREQHRREAAERRERRDREARGAIARVRAGRGARLEALLSAEGDKTRA